MTLNSGNRAIEQAEAMVARERDAAVRTIRQRLAAPGVASCHDCGEAISRARRTALPSARRCTDCERRHELKKKRGW